MPAGFGPSALKSYLDERLARVNAYLDGCLPEESRTPETLHRAMRYSLFSGGKRIRPVLVIAGAEAVGGKSDQVLGLAAALELIHTYTLIHDDLPALDNDDYRRGRLTCHKVFGEAVALLAGDALLTKAFELLSNPKEFPSVPPERLLDVAGQIARTAGSTCLVGGQVVDLESEGKQVDLPLLEYIHVNKTGGLIVTSVTAGARLCGAEQQSLRALARYGECIGLVFQITDDLLDVIGDRETLGKNTGGDRVRGKATYPAVLGISESRSRAGELTGMAIDHLAAFDERADPLRALALFLHDRDR
ncbi:MAG: polyprenyl synthetase family protein [Deltaproteobacteria bacterium]|nr:polyprenyl synthetase family protein [Deltaproteobacteria bacterium]